MGLQRIRHDLATEQQPIIYNYLHLILSVYHSPVLKPLFMLLILTPSFYHYLVNFLLPILFPDHFLSHNTVTDETLPRSFLSSILPFPSQTSSGSMTFKIFDVIIALKCKALLAQLRATICSGPFV